MVEAIGESIRYRTDIRKYGDITLMIPEGVWQPYVTGQHLAHEVMPYYRSAIEGRVVADIGTGSGLLAVKAGKLGAELTVATDLNPRAVETVQSNWTVNDLPMNRLVTAESDGFNNIPVDLIGRLDFVIANPPVQPFLKTNGEDRNGDPYAWNEAEANGRGVLDEILIVGSEWLSPTGKIVTTTTTRHGHKQTTDLLNTLAEMGRIHDWKVMYAQTQKLAPFYDPYIPVWQQLQDNDGDTRIWQDENGEWYHRYMILEISK